MDLGKIVKVINSHRSFLLSTHENVEGDALGSELAMFLLLKRLGKKIYMYNSQKVPFNYNFLPFSSQVQTAKPRGEFDVGIILDCSDISRLGSAKNSFLR